MYLITYQALSCDGAKVLTKNCVTEKAPATWLLEYLEEWPDSECVLISSLAVTYGDYMLLSEHL